MASSPGAVSGKRKMSYVSHFQLVNMSLLCRKRVNPYHNFQEVMSVLNPSYDEISAVIGMINAVVNWRERMTAVLLPSDVSYGPESADKFLDVVEKERITWHCGYPFELINAVQSPNFHKYDVSCLRGGSIVGNVLSPESKIKISAHCPDIQSVFGSTEALAGLSTSVVYSSREQRLHSIGYPFPHCEVKLVDDDDVIIPIGTEGEICIRGWTVFKGYLNDPERTSTAKHPTKSGWYHYGDLGIMDETGHVTYTGRKAECKRFNHYNDLVYPDRILAVTKKCDKINEAQVIGVDNDLSGHDICLFVEPSANETLTEAELRVLFDELPPVQRPDHYFIMEMLPRTKNRNKVNYNLLQKTAESRVKEMKND